MSYNILADCYADTETAKNELFAHCPVEFLDVEYRKMIYLKELIGKYINDNFIGDFLKFVYLCI